MSNRRLIRVAKSVQPLPAKYFLGKTAKRDYRQYVSGFNHARSAILEEMGVRWTIITKMYHEVR